MLENVEYKRHLNRLPNYFFALSFVIRRSEIIHHKSEAVKGEKGKRKGKFSWV